MSSWAHEFEAIKASLFFTDDRDLVVLVDLNVQQQEAKSYSLVLCFMSAAANKLQAIANYLKNDNYHQSTNDHSGSIIVIYVSFHWHIESENEKERKLSILLSSTLTTPPPIRIMQNNPSQGDLGSTGLGLLAISH